MVSGIAVRACAVLVTVAGVVVGLLPAVPPVVATPGPVAPVVASAPVVSGLGGLRSASESAAVSGFGTRGTVAGSPARRVSLSAAGPTTVIQDVTSSQAVSLAGSTTPTCSAQPAQTSPPANDAFEGAVEIDNAGDSYTSPLVPQSDATTQTSGWVGGGDPNTEGNAIWSELGYARSEQKSLWWRYRPAVSGTVAAIQTYASPGDVYNLNDTQMGFWRQRPGFYSRALTLVAGDQDAGPGYRAGLSNVPVVAGETYYVQVGHYNGNPGVPLPGVILTVTGAPASVAPAPVCAMDREAVRGCAGCAFFHNEYQVLKAGPVNTATGQAMERRTDVAIPGPGVPAVWSRTYNGDDTTDGPLGVGWSTDFTSSLSTPSSSDVKVVEPTGAVLRFTLQADGSYQPGPGIRAKLVKLADGSWQLTSRSAKRVWTYGTGGRLTGVSNLIGPAGVGVTLTYDTSRLSRVSDSVGRWMDLTYGTAGAADSKVTSVRTSDGRVVSYGYTMVAGKPHLTSSTSPAGRVTTWSYDATSGKLNGFTKPDGTSESDTYDAATGRIKSQVSPDGGLWTFGWVPATDISGGEGSGVATSTDPDGNVTKETYAGFVLQSSTNGEGGVTKYAYDGDLQVGSVTDPAGGVSSMTYDDRGNVLTKTTKIDTGTSATETWTYNGFDQPLTYTNGENETTTYTYTPTGLRSDVTDALGHATHTDYNALGQPTTITTPMGRVVAMAYDQVGNLTSQTTPAGGITRFEYTAAGLVKRTISPRGNLTGATAADQEQFSTWRAYDADGVLTSEISPDDNTTVYTPDAQGNPAQALTTDATGQRIEQVTWTRNSAGEVLTRTRRDPGSTAERVETFTYTPGGLLKSATDVLGAVTAHAYDHNQNLVRSTLTADGVDRVTTYTYDSVGRLTSTTSPVGAVDSISYDLAGEVVSSTAPSGAVTRYGYDKAGRLTSLAEQYTGGGTTTQTWDKAGRLTSRKLPGATTAWTYGYNNDDQMTTKTSPSGASIWSWTHTPDGLVDKETLPAGATYVTDYDYTPDNLLKTVVNAEGGRTDYNHDALGRVTTVTGKLDATTNTATATRYNPTGTVKDVTVNGTTVLTYAYNAFNDLTSSRNARGNTTAYATNAAGQVTSSTDPLNRVRSFAYNQAGELTLATNASGSSVARTYDKAGLPTTQDPSDGPAETYTYTAGRLASFTDATGTTALSYNGRDQLTGVDGPGTDDYTYTYKTDANLASRTLPASGAISYAYNTDGLVANQTFDGQQVTYGYDLNGWPTTTTLPTTSGRREVRTYNKVGQIASTTLQTTAATPATVTKHVYTRNAAGLPTAVTRTGTETGKAVTASNSYTYNARGWLTRWCKATTSCTTTAANRVDYGYDAVGNATNLTRVGTVGDPGTITRAYDAADQLSSTTRSGGTSPGTVPTTWTLDGQSTAQGRTYDGLGRLTGKTNPGGTGRVTYVYTAQGNRAKATTSAGTRSLSWDINNPMPMPAVTTNGAVTTAHRYNPDGTILASRHPAAAYPVTWYAHDAMGSVTDTLNAAGSQLRNFTYDPWGTTLTNTVRTTGALESSFGYTGAWHEPADTDYHLRARDYNPALGAFTAPDPVNASPELSTYQYAVLAPTLYTDPTGNCPWCAVAGAVAGGIISGTVYAVSHQDDDFTWTGMAGATAGGAIGGAIIGGTLGAGAGLVEASMVGGLGGALGAVTDTTATSLLEGEGIPGAGELLCSGIQGGAYGAIGGLLGYGGSKALSAALSRNAAKTGDDAVRLFRNVDATEFDAIAGTGRFTTGPGMMEGKWFATSGEHAEQWGAKLNGGQGLTVETRIPRSVADQLHHEAGKLDGIGPGWYADGGGLDAINRFMDGIRVWP